MFFSNLLYNMDQDILDRQYKKNNLKSTYDEKIAFTKSAVISFTFQALCFTAIQKITIRIIKVNSHKAKIFGFICRLSWFFNGFEN